MKGSLVKFLDEVGYEYNEKALSREYEVSRLLKGREGNGRAQLFNIEGSELRSSGNVVDSRDKAIKALMAKNLEDAYRRLIESSLGGHNLKLVGSPILREAKHGLKSLPFVKFYEKDGGLYLTSSLVISCFEGICNSSIHRVMLLNENEGVIRLVPRHLYYLYKKAIKKGVSLPISIIVGVHPAIMLASSTSPSLGRFEIESASNILGSLEVYRSPIHGNPVPYASAFIAEGYITGHEENEGPFVEAMGCYDKVRMQPVLKVKRVYLNADEVSHVILPGGLEHKMLMGFPREANIWNSVSKVVPKVYGARLTEASGGWLHAIISIEKTHDGDGKNAILAAFASHPSLKHVVVVDGDINIDDPGEVEWAIATRFQGKDDLVIINNARGSSLDPSSINGNTTKIGVDATMPLGDRERFEKAKIPG